jgi:hypothetical protein
MNGFLNIAAGQTEMGHTFKPKAE